MPRLRLLASYELPGAAAFDFKAAGFDLLLPLHPNFYLTATVLIQYNSLVQYSAPVSPGLFYFQLKL